MLPINSPQGRLRPLGELIFFCYFSDGMISERGLSAGNGEASAS